MHVPHMMHTHMHMHAMCTQCIMLCISHHACHIVHVASCHVCCVVLHGHVAWCMCVHLAAGGGDAQERLVPRKPVLG